MALSVKLRGSASGPILEGPPGNVLVMNVDGSVGTEAIPPVGAGDVDYTPTRPFDWPDVAPANVAAALDSLADVSASGLQAGSGAAQNPFVFATSSIPTKKSGNFLVWATIIGTCSAPANVALVLKGNGINLSTGTIGSGNANHVGMCLVGMFSQNSPLADLVFELDATPSTGTITVTGGECRIAWMELGG
jgi:hypothetical protein